MVKVIIPAFCDTALRLHERYSSLWRLGAVSSEDPRFVETDTRFRLMGKDYFVTVIMACLFKGFSPAFVQLLLWCSPRDGKIKARSWTCANVRM